MSDEAQTPPAALGKFLIPVTKATGNYQVGDDLRTLTAATHDEDAELVLLTIGGLTLTVSRLSFSRAAKALDLCVG